MSVGPANRVPMEAASAAMARPAALVSHTWEHQMETAIAGAIAGLVAETIVHPFDTVSHRSKVSGRRRVEMRISISRPLTQLELTSALSIAGAPFQCVWYLRGRV